MAEASSGSAAGKDELDSSWAARGGEQQGEWTRDAGLRAASGGRVCAWEVKG